ncbi:hypothetical protein PLCT2_02952 [Planctomycetaceae bacterium]|nr:hypothetical protein PLCT2_02952 [Planctomycetaceae bacterium]
MRSGVYIKQPEDYRAYIPAPLPPNPGLAIDDECWELLSEADSALAELNATTALLPNPELFISMFVKKEALLSSQIEGTQASLNDILRQEAQALHSGRPKAFEEVFNYIRAMNKGLARLKDLPISLRLIKEMHYELLSGVRGGNLDPGEFRRSQNWIGPAGCTLNDASFVPPPPHEVLPCMGELEKYIHDTKQRMPILIKTALVHYQFETIHPFLDGNGRLGRLLITFLLVWKGRLLKPVLYLSTFFKQNKAQYYGHLQSAREGALEEWVKFFLRGVAQVSREGSETAHKIQAMREKHRDMLQDGRSATAVVLLEHLFKQPVVDVHTVARKIKRTFKVAAELVEKFERLGLLREITGQARNRLFEYTPYVKLFGKLEP